jgi:hypothetical protein
MGRVRLAVAVAAVGLLVAPARGLETDQFYAWTTPLSDSSEALNQHINAEIDQVLQRVNARPDCSCATARQAIQRHLHYPFITQVELWILNTPYISRFPHTSEEERTFRQTYLYSGRSPFDPVRWMPASPTIEIGGVRMGADKLGHFFSVGGWIEGPYRRAVEKGASSDEAIEQAIVAGLWAERTILGGGASGVVSPADMEANYQGLLFYRSLCDGPEPALGHDSDGWHLVKRLDLRAYVTPEWDESWQPNIYAKSRWAKIRPSMERYCPQLDDPLVQAQRAAYAQRDVRTPTETLIERMVAEGKLEDPRQFSIDAVCAGRPGGSGGSKSALAKVD